MEKINTFIKYAHMAPSSHNAKMWKTEIDSCENKIIVSIDTNATLPKVDPNNREAWISLGAFTQNLEFICQDFGYKAHINEKEREIIVSFSKDTLQNPSNFYQTLLPKRHTLRKPFKKESITHLLPERVLKNTNVRYIDRNHKFFKELVRLSQKANIQQIENFSKREELAKWMNFTQDNPHRGLNLKNLGMNAMERFIFRNFIKEKGFIHSKWVRKKYIQQSTPLYQQCSGYLLITSKENNWKEQFTSGRLLEKIWIELTQKGIGLHPMSQLIEEEPFYSQAKKILSLKGEIQMLIRVGLPLKTN